MAPGLVTHHWRGVGAWVLAWVLYSCAGDRKRRVQTMPARADKQVGGCGKRQRGGRKLVKAEDGVAERGQRSTPHKLGTSKKKKGSYCCLHEFQIGIVKKFFNTHTSFGLHF